MIKKLGLLIVLVFTFLVVAKGAFAQQMPQAPSLPGTLSMPTGPGAPSLPPTPFLPPTPQLPPYPPCPECDDFVVEPTPTQTADATPTTKPSDPPSSGTGGGGGGGGGDGGGGSSSSGDSGRGGAVLGATGVFEENVFALIFAFGSILTAVGLKKQHLANL